MIIPPLVYRHAGSSADGPGTAAKSELRPSAWIDDQVGAYADVVVVVVLAGAGEVVVDGVASGADEVHAATASTAASASLRDHDELSSLMVKTVAASRIGVNPYPPAMARGVARGEDGRTARSRRTRDQAVDALLALLREGVANPTVADVAERTGVTTRSIHANFASIEALHRAAVDRATVEVLGRISPIDVTAPLADRIDALCRQRAVIHEHLAPLRRAARAREATSPALAEARTTALAAAREQVGRVFAAELADLSPAARRRTAAAVDAAAGDGAWDLWRGGYELSPTVARRTMVESVTRLLTTP